jgi:hypothetical protein
VSERRYAVLIASSQFPKEPKLQPLRCPENDVNGINKLLTSEVYGSFDESNILKNSESRAVEFKIHEVLKKATRDDLVLIYYSGHGKVDRTGRLHLATIDTSEEFLKTTSVSIGKIWELIDDSDSKKIVLILDCCYSGAASGTFIKKGGLNDELNSNFIQGSGTYILTASNPVQVAFEKEGDLYSILSKHIIEGIEEGGADKDDDGLVSMGELYEYVYEQVRKESSQTPMKWALGVQGGDLIIARTGKAPRAERRRQIRKMLLEQDNELPDRIIAKALEILQVDYSRLGGKQVAYNNLLETFHQGHLTRRDFIERWHSIDYEPPSKSNEVEFQIAKPTAKFSHPSLAQPSVLSTTTDSKVKPETGPPFTVRWHLFTLRFFYTAIILTVCAVLIGIGLIKPQQADVPATSSIYLWIGVSTLWICSWAISFLQIPRGIVTRRRYKKLYSYPQWARYPALLGISLIPLLVVASLTMGKGSKVEFQVNNGNVSAEVGPTMEGANKAQEQHTPNTLVTPSAEAQNSPPTEQLNKLSLDRDLSEVEISFKPSAEQWSKIAEAYQKIKSPVPDMPYIDAPLVAERIGDHWKIDFEPVKRPTGTILFAPVFTNQSEYKGFEDVIREASIGLLITWGDVVETDLESWRGDYPSAIKVSQDSIVLILRPPLLRLSLSVLYDNPAIILRGRNPPNILRFRSLDPGVMFDQTISLDWKRSPGLSYKENAKPYVSGPHPLRITFKTVSR